MNDKETTTALDLPTLDDKTLRGNIIIPFTLLDKFDEDDIEEFFEMGRSSSSGWHDNKDKQKKYKKVWNDNHIATA